MSEETAFSLDPHEALACSIAFREMASGGQYDWENGVWIEVGG